MATLLTPTREIAAQEAEMTVNQAAEYLDVPTTRLIEMLDAGELSYRMAAGRRRVRIEDLRRRREEEFARRVKVMENLTEETERLGLYK